MQPPARPIYGPGTPQRIATHPAWVKEQNVTSKPFRPTSQRRSSRFARVVGPLVAGAALWLPAGGGAVVNAGHTVTSNPSDELVILEGYNPAAGPVTVGVFRAGLRIATAGPFVPPTPPAPVEINHVGSPACWTRYTPDLVQGDVVRVTQASAVEESVIRNIVIDAPVGNPLTNTVTVDGTAHDAAGQPLDVESLEVRLVNPAFQGFGGGGPFLRTPNHGTITPGAAGQFIATFAALPLNIYTAALAPATETGASWTSPTEIAEVTLGAAGGPVLDCAASPGAPYGATQANPNVIVPSTATLQVRGAARSDATAISAIDVSDGATSLPFPGEIDVPSQGAAGRTWTALINADDLSGLNDGLLTITPSFVVAGNPVAGFPIQVLKAAAIPVPAIVGPTVFTNSQATFSFSTTPAFGGLTFECRIGAAAFAPCTSPHTTVLPNGIHTFEVLARDSVSNPGAAGSRSFGVAAPTPVVQIAGPPSLSNSPTATFSFSASPAAVTFTCNRDALGAAACDSQTTFGTPLSPLAEGAHTLVVRGTDALGNVGGPTTHNWTIDLTPPGTTVTAAPAAKVNITTAVFEMTSNDPTATFECSLDNGLFVACASPATFTDIPDGTHSMRIRAKDPAGNVDPSPEIRDWNINGPPATALTAAPPATTTATSATFRFTSPDDPAATFECSLDGAAFAFCASPTTDSALTLGSHTFRVRAVDAAGTADPTPATHAWTIAPPDTERPTITASLGLLAKLTVGRNGVLVARATCDERCTIIAKATISVPSPIRGGKRTLYALTSKTIDSAAGATSLARIKLSARQLRVVRNALKTGKRVKITVTVVGTDPSGNTSNALRTVTLTRKYL